MIRLSRALCRIHRQLRPIRRSEGAGKVGGISPDAAVQAAQSALKDASPVVASVTFAALTYMWATSAASANGDATGRQNAYNAASSVLSNFDSSVPVSLQTGTAGMSRAVAQLTSETDQNKGVVANAVLQSISAMEGCVSVARMQGAPLELFKRGFCPTRSTPRLTSLRYCAGYGTLVDHYSKAVAQATNCVMLSVEGHKDAGCAATILSYTYLHSSGS